MKHLNQFITEYIIKKKLEKPIDSEDHYDYYPKTKDKLIENLNELISKDIYDFNCIDTSSITDMSHLFDMSLKKLIKYSLKNVNFNISEWDVSNVENMEYMFYGCKKFDANLSKWNVSNVKDINNMFCLCSDFRGKGLENWDVSNVNIMNGLFYYCTNFNCDLSGWDVSNVKNMDYIFSNCMKLKKIPSWYK